MAYLEQTTTTVTDIPALIASFALARGWTVSGTTITRPGGGKSFEITASIGGTNNRDHLVYVKDTANPTVNQVWTAMPWINGVYLNPLVQTPTKIHLLGNEGAFAPEPWIACIIECGYNMYRHIYIGNVVKAGNYTGGELISANMYSRNLRYSLAVGSDSFGGDAPVHRYLFSARYDTGGLPDSVGMGGVNIVHADNAAPFRMFKGPTGPYVQIQFDGEGVIGGNADDVSAGLVARGLSDYAGSNILVPVNLFAPDSSQIEEDIKFRPIGYAAGVRMINVSGINPGDSITIGSKIWRVFPEFSRQTETSTPYGASNPLGFYYPFETSYMVGLAYEEA